MQTQLQRRPLFQRAEGRAELVAQRPHGGPDAARRLLEQSDDFDPETDLSGAASFYDRRARQWKSLGDEDRAEADAKRSTEYAERSR